MDDEKLYKALELYEITRYGKLNRGNGDSKRRVSDDDIINAYEIYGDKLTDAAKHLGIGPTSYTQRLMRLGLKQPSGYAKKSAILRIMSKASINQKRHLIHDVDASLDYLLNLPLVCSLTGLDITLPVFSSYGSRLESGTASIDRIDSEKGYTPDNVRFVHRTVNRIIGSVPEDLLLELSKRIYKNAKSE